jgi:yecA family protein
MRVELALEHVPASASYRLVPKGKVMRQKYRRPGQYPAPLLLPPSLRTLGALPFSGQNFAELDAWLAEDGWPNERMDVAMLEGYLAALIVWPINLSPGAWLPRIWGIRGWKVAAKIEIQEKYDRFIQLIVGMLQDLERRLVSCPPVQTAVFTSGAPHLSGKYFAGAAWATGFMTALQENSVGFAMRSEAARTAVVNIAQYASRRSDGPRELAATATAISSALSVILAERPGGPVERVALKRAALLRASNTLAMAQLQGNAS